MSHLRSAQIELQQEREKARLDREKHASMLRKETSEAEQYLLTIERMQEELKRETDARRKAELKLSSIEPPEDGSNEKKSKERGKNLSLTLKRTITADSPLILDLKDGEKGAGEPSHKTNLSIDELQQELNARDTLISSIQKKLRHSEKKRKRLEEEKSLEGELKAVLEEIE